MTNSTAGFDVMLLVSKCSLSETENKLQILA